MNDLSIKPLREIGAIRKEYKKLKARAEHKYDVEDYFGWIHGSFTAVVTIATAIQTGDLGTTVIAFFLYGYIPGLIVSTIISGLLYFPILRPLFRLVEKRRPSRPWYTRYLQLQEFIVEHDRQEAEAKRLRLIPVRKEIANITQDLQLIAEILESLQDFYQRKRKWYSHYGEDHEKILNSVDKLIGLEEKGSLIRARFGAISEEVSYDFLQLFRLISTLQNRCNSLLSKMQSLQDWSPPIRTTTPRRASQTPERQEQSRDRVSESSVVTGPQPNQVVDQQTVRAPVVVPKVVIPPRPPKRRVLNRELAAVPLEEYVGAAKARMEIGDLGEVVALHYELRRVEEETQSTANGKVTRVSKEIGNLGYDIESISQGNNVFIEVKSTTGGFWTDFFLSSNEFEVMRRLGDEYWLYRIFELSRNDGSAKLSIFRGRKEIESYFEFEPTNYKFIGRTTNAPDGRLFEI